MTVTLTGEHRGPGVRALGLLGIVGGIALLAAFIVSLSTSLNTVRIVLFLAGGVAVALAAHEPQAKVSRRLATAAAAPLIVASAALGAWILLSIGRDHPFA